MESHDNQKAESDRMSLETPQSPALQAYFLGALSAMTLQYFMSLAKLGALSCDPPSLVPTNRRPSFCVLGKYLVSKP